MIIFVCSNYSKAWCNKTYTHSGETIIVESCGTDSVFRPDQRLSFYNMKLSMFEYLRQLRHVNKFDLIRAHRVESFRDITDATNAVSEYIKLDYKNSVYLSDNDSTTILSIGEKK